GHGKHRGESVTERAVSASTHLATRGRGWKAGKGRRGPARAGGGGARKSGRRARVVGVVRIRRGRREQPQRAGRVLREPPGDLREQLVTPDRLLERRHVRGER